MQSAKRKILLTIFLFFILAGFLTLHRNPLQNDDASLLDKPPLGIWLLGDDDLLSPAAIFRKLNSSPPSSYT
ncbi:hypothetical protein HZB07_05780 [Candidatus Saganbacteria bacterium]|nr:hypothetical protein [Candidatus Saganbacteria bacterium]